jgi:hypothetical protein
MTMYDMKWAERPLNVGDLKDWDGVYDSRVSRQICVSHIGGMKNQCTDDGNKQRICQKIS